MKEAAIGTEDKEVKEANRKFYKSVMYVGIALFLVGGFLVLQSVASILMFGKGQFFIWSPFLTLLGVGQIIYGLNGIRKER